MVSTQEWLYNEVKEKRGKDNVSSLEVDRKNITGSLNIEGFKKLEYINFKGVNNKLLGFLSNDKLIIKLNDLPRLTKFIVEGSKLTSLEISNCPKIKEINIKNNLVKNVDFLESLNFGELTHLDIRNNLFSSQSLDFLRQFKNLKVLKLGKNNRTEIDPAYRGYNKFFGSLEPLREMTKLEKLDISNTEIKEGLGCLPDNLKVIRCGGFVGLGGNAELLEKLKGYRLSDKPGKHDYNLQGWREAQDYYKEKNKLEQEVENLRVQPLSLEQTRVQSPPPRYHSYSGEDFKEEYLQKPEEKGYKNQIEIPPKSN